MKRELNLVLFSVMSHFSYVAYNRRNWEGISSFVHHEPNDKHAWPGWQGNIFKVSQIYRHKIYVLTSRWNLKMQWSAVNFTTFTINWKKKQLTRYNNSCVSVVMNTEFFLFTRAHQLEKKFFQQRNGQSQHTLYAMGHAHMDSGKI